MALDNTVHNGVVVDKEQLELVRWLITTIDDSRASLESRAGTVVGVITLLFGGFIFLMEQTLSDIGQCSLIEQVVLCGSIFVTIALLAPSIISAAFAIANVRTTSRRMFGADMPDRLFLYPRMTFETFGDFKSYSEGFTSTSKEQMMEYMLGELWVLIHEYHNRYQHLRRALRLLCLSLIPVCISVITLFIGHF
jgi:hypothetical protein